MQYAVIIEPTATGFSACVPDVPGCVAAGETEAKVTALIREALEFHFEELRRDGDPIPQPVSRLEHVESASPDTGVEGRSPYVVVIERGPTSRSAYVPDLPGCVAVADTEARVRKLIREGISLYLEDMARDGEAFPEPISRIAYVEVGQAASVA
jgi:predicted RNase H-like HicB family nuclease